MHVVAGVVLVSAHGAGHPLVRRRLFRWPTNRGVVYGAARIRIPLALCGAKRFRGPLPLAGQGSHLPRGCAFAWVLLKAA